MVGRLEANSTGGLDCSENRDLGGGKAAHHRAIERAEVGVPLGHQIGRGKSAVPKRFPEVNSTGGLDGPESRDVGRGKTASVPAMESARDWGSCFAFVLFSPHLSACQPVSQIFASRRRRSRNR